MSSTFRNEGDSTYSGDPRRRASDAAEQVAAQWESGAKPDLPAALAMHPAILGDRSVFLDLVQKEYRLRRDEWRERPPTHYVERFRSLDEDLLLTLHKLIEVEQCLGDLSIGNLLNLPDEPDWPAENEQFNEFHLVRELGRGAVARVFLCSQTSLGGREVVVKIARAMTYEASILGTLDHPHVMQVHSVGVDETTGLGWICMPFCGSWTLQDAISQAFKSSSPSSFSDLLPSSCTDATSGRPPTRMPYEEGVLRLLAQLADGLAYVHSRDLLHGDLKASNVILSDAGVPLLIDFNLSQSISGQAGLAGGTLPYMAPELLTAVASRDDLDGCRVNTATEVFAFGVLFYQALLGRLPYTSTPDSRGLNAVAQTLLDGYSAFQDDTHNALIGVDPRAARLIQQCLSENPAARPADFRDVQRRLTRLLSPLARVERLSRRRPKSLVAIATLATLLVSGLSLTAWRQPEADTLLRKAQGHFEAGRFRMSIALLEQQVANAPQDQHTRRLLATSLLRSGDAAAATDHFLQLWRNFHQASDIAMAGYCKNKIGQHAAALPLYREAIAADYISAAIENNIAASLLVRLATDFDQEVSDTIEQHLLKAYQLDTRNESIRLAMLRHYLLASKSVQRRRPDYPPAITSLPSRETSREFCIKALKFLVLSSASEDDLQLFGMPCLRRLSSIVGYDSLNSSLGQPLIERYQALPAYMSIKEVASAVEARTPAEFIDPSGNLQES